MNNLLPLLIVVAVIVLVFYMQRCSLSCKCDRDNYGQDASIRAAAGWVAGPNGKSMYGYDPIDKFAAEIEESKMKFRHKVDKAGCRDACMGRDQDTCGRCLDDAGASKDGIETLVIGIMPLEAPRNPEPGYKRRRENHPPYVPSDIEFDEGYRKRKSCMSCS